MIIHNPPPSNEEECRRRLNLLAITSEDAARIHKIDPAIKARLESIVGEFYDDLARYPEAAVFFPDDATLRHVKNAQIDHFARLTSGNYGPDHFIDTLRLGRRQEATGLPIHWHMSSYMHYFRRAGEIIARDTALTPQEALAALSSLAKLLVLDVTLGIEAYLDARLSRDGIFQSSKLSMLVELISSVAHELGAPTTAAPRGDGPSTAAAINDYLRQCQSIGRNLLSFAHSQPSLRVQVDLNRLVSDTIAIFEFQLTRHNILLRSNLEPDLRLVNANPTQLKEVLAHLLVGAQHAIHAGRNPGRIVISTRNEGERVLCIVEHNGDATHEAEETATDVPLFVAPTGSRIGPGLRTCRAILRDHGGDLTVTSGKDGGVTTFELPLARESSALAPGPHALLQGKRVLVVENKPRIRSFVSDLLERAEAKVGTAFSAGEARKSLQAGATDLAVISNELPDGCAEEVLFDIISRPPEMRPAVIIFAEGCGDQGAVSLAESAGFLCLCKPFTGEQIVKAAIDALANKGGSRRLTVPACCSISTPTIIEPAMAKKEGAGARNALQNLVGSSTAMQEVFRRLRLSSQSDVAVLLTGETGTGKELVARAIHDLGDRKHGRFVAVNCSAFPDTLLESELFGHVRGAFTGAIRDKVGVFQAAEGGTLFLDEVGDMSPLLQLKLLRVLEEMEIRRVGDDRPVKISVRLITATHRDLPALIAAGLMREDFYYRIRVFRIHTPPLRERKEDIPALAAHFMEQLSRSGKKRVTGIATDAMERLMTYSWPGNVRELRNAVEHSFVSIRGGVLSVNDLPPEIRIQVPPAPVPPLQTSPEPDADRGDLGERLERERRRILDALQKHGGNKTKAARSLGITRVTLWNRINRLRSALERFSASDAIESSTILPPLIRKPTRTVPPLDEAQQVERRRILDALRKSGGNKTQAAKVLGITRVTLRNRMIRLGIQPTDS